MIKKLFCTAALLMCSLPIFAQTGPLWIAEEVYPPYNHPGAPLAADIEVGIMTSCNYMWAPEPFDPVSLRCETIASSDLLGAFGIAAGTVEKSDDSPITLQLITSWVQSGSSVGSVDIKQHTSEVTLKESLPGTGKYEASIIHWITCSERGGTIHVWGDGAIIGGASGTEVLASDYEREVAPMVSACPSPQEAEPLNSEPKPHPDWTWYPAPGCLGGPWEPATFGEYNSMLASSGVSFKFPGQTECNEQPQFVPITFYRSYGTAMCFGPWFDFGSVGEASAAGKVSFRLGGVGVCTLIGGGMEP